MRRGGALVTALVLLVLAGLCLGLLFWVAPVGGQAPLEVQATATQGGGVAVAWTTVDQGYLGCVLRVGQGRDQLLGCAVPWTATAWTQGTGSRDLAATVVPGDVLEVRVWSADGELLARGRTTVGAVVRLPSITKPPAR